MPEAHLKYMLRTVFQQKCQLGFVVIGKVGLTDSQRDTSDSQVERFRQAVYRSFIGKFLGDQQGYAAEFLHQRIGGFPMVRA